MSDLHTYRKFLKRVLCSIFLVLLSFYGQAQNNTKESDVYVDKNGVMRWGGTDTEVKGFGVNYTVPFAHAYRTAKKLGIDLKRAIDKDVYHFARLGFDLYRVHVWDTEISDAEGNLLENEHLELFDYLLKKLKERNINFVITPIAYWGNGWPEPDEDTPGFSHKYGKEKSLTSPEAIKAQQNYLAQFLNHVNPYTGAAYKNEPNLIAFEISNEPHHHGDPGEVTRFIDKMVKAMRGTGTKKPIFYNVSHSISLEEAYFDADIQGGTFQWYPTGLGFGEELEGNLLPNVNDYNIPFDSIIKKNHAAKIVYEFDAADVLKSYIYPAMARSFREAGIQIATQFAYDPTYMAYANTEYNTHYMNLAYTPRKALSLMIAAKVFHEVPLNADFGTYPKNLEFGDFKVSYLKDLAVYNAEHEFIYTNNNKIEPKSPKDLKHIAGYGNSKLVNYEGKGAYFLDKLKKGVWRLEVMPDPILIKNPFGKNSLEKTVAVINWKAWNMNLTLPDLKGDFSIEGLNEGNNFSGESSEGSFLVSPGTYLIRKEGKSFNAEDVSNSSNIGLREFTAPEGTVERTYVVHKPAKVLSDSSSYKISAQVVSNEKIQKVEAWLQNGNVYENVALGHQSGYTYATQIPKKLIKNGFLQYRTVVTTGDGAHTFPGNINGTPAKWDFHSEQLYKVKILKSETPIYLFEAAQDHDNIVGKWKLGNGIVPTQNPGEAEYQVKVEKLFEPDIENKNPNPIYDYSFRYNFNKKVNGRLQDLRNRTKLVIKARALGKNPEKMQVALLSKDGSAFGKIIEFSTNIEEYEIPLSELKPVKTVTLPRPYPSFLPYYFKHSNTAKFDIKNSESLQFSMGPGISPEKLKQAHEVGIISVWLE